MAVHLNDPGRAVVGVAVKPPAESFRRLETTCCRGGLGVAAASGEARSTQGLLEVWQSSQGLGRLEELGRVVVVQPLYD